MPEIVQDETVSETNPVKGEKLNGASNEAEELKENGSESKLAKNGHPEPSKESAVDDKIVDNGNSADAAQDKTASSAEEVETTPLDEKSAAESEKVSAVEDDKTNEKDNTDEQKEIVEDKDTVEVETKDVKEEDKKLEPNTEVSGSEVESSDQAVASEDSSKEQPSSVPDVADEKACENTAADSSCNEPETKEENVAESLPKESDVARSDKVTDVNTETAETMEVESTTDTKETKENKETSPDEPSSAGGSKHSDCGIPEDIDSMITEGRACMVKNNYNGAADLLGKACEKLRELFGELDDKCAQVYYYYGCAMLECAKTENSVLGEGVNKEESESEEEEIPMVKEKENQGGDDNVEEDNSKVNGDSTEGVEPSKDEPMETLDNEESEEDAKEKEDSEEEVKDKAEPEEEVKDGDESTEENTDITLNKEDEEEDTTLKAAWETLELAKFIFERQNNKKMLADTYLKLGEVAVESGHKTGFDDMKKCLELRSTFYGENHRAIPETHFNIGLSYSLFEMFDEAIEQFETSKDLLLKRIEMLENNKEEDATTEINEIKGLLPDIDEKIKDMKESKEEKAKADDTLKKKEDAGSSSTTSEKTVSNLNHLVKRKRKIEEVAEALPEKEPKQACVEKETS